jgi:hypothetical protein
VSSEEVCSDPGSALLAPCDAALPEVYGYLASYASGLAVEDLTAETILAAVAAGRRQTPPVSGTSCLNRIVRRKFLDQWRAAEWQRPLARRGVRAGSSRRSVSAWSALTTRVADSRWPRCDAIGFPEAVGAFAADRLPLLPATEGARLGRDPSVRRLLPHSMAMFAVGADRFVTAGPAIARPRHWHRRHRPARDVLRAGVCYARASGGRSVQRAGPGAAACWSGWLRSASAKQSPRSARRARPCIALVSSPPTGPGSSRHGVQRGCRDRAARTPRPGARTGHGRSECFRGARTPGRDADRRGRLAVDVVARDRNCADRRDKPGSERTYLRANASQLPRAPVESGSPRRRRRWIT